MNELTIGEVARRGGLRASALRYYKSVGALPPARRLSGQRRSLPNILSHLALVRVAKEAGFTVAEMRELFSGFSTSTPASKRWHALARSKLDEVEQLIRRAHAMKRILQQGLKCGCVRIEDCALLTRSAYLRNTIAE